MPARSQFRSRSSAYRDLLYQHNQHTNLTAVRDLDGIERRLVVESLRLAEPLKTLLDTESSRDTP